MKPAAVPIIAQALALGLLVAFLIVPGAAVFLDVYGPARLPYVYLVVAVLGALVSFGLTALQARLGLAQLGLATTLAVAAATLACWAFLYFGDADWASFAVLVLFALEVQLGFVFIGAQAGRAFDVQELKRIFSFIVAGFVFGFMVGGFVAAGFTALGWDAVHLLAVSAATTLVMAAAMTVTARQLPEPVGEDSAEPGERPPSLRRILAVPLVRAVFAYQVLSAMGTQLLEYLVYDRAAARYSGTQELAGFMGTYSALLNLVDLLVLVTVGGLLMTRYGLRYGLGANPVVATATIVAAAVVALVSGPDATLFFFLVAAARIADLTLVDASARTAINATFKALPLRQRLAAQVGVEGAGVPLALGLTAVLILAVNAIPGADVTYVLVATLLVCVAWTISAWATYHRYQAAVIAAARRRSLDGDAVDLDEPATRSAVRTLLASSDPRDVAVAATLLAHDGGADVAGLLAAAAANPSLDVQRAVLGPLVPRDPGLARTVALRLVGSGSPAHVLDGLRALGRLPGPLDPALVDPFLADGDVRLRAAAAGALLRHGGADALAGTVADAARSDDPADRAFAARTIAEAGRTPSPEVLAGLIGDADPAVRDAAAAAVAALDDPGRMALLAMPLAPRERVRFLRACRSNPSAGFAAKVAGALARDGAPLTELLGVLAAAGWRAGDADRPTVVRLVRREAERIAQAAAWTDALASDEARLAESCGRLRRALAQEAAAAGRRLLDLLGLIHDRRLTTRVSRVLEGRVAGDAGLALESLDVVLSAELRGPVTRALQTAFAGGIAGHGRKPRTADDLAATAREFGRGCGWATRPDWLLACVLVLMRDLGLPRDAVTPLGPVSAELVAAR